MKDKIIEAENLTKTYKKSVKAVANISFSVEGELFGFLGPNGVGKTTTIKMLTALSAITSGKATVAGHDVGKNPAAVRKIIGIVPQEPTADEQTLYFATPRGLEFLDTYWKMKGFIEIFNDSQLLNKEKRK